MRKFILFFALLLAGYTTKAQYYGDDYSYRSDRYYYDESFDWRWDIRVRITEGIQKGLITPREADMLYNRLERLERMEYAYQADGYFDGWEQDEVWNEVVWLNRQVGLELYDADRTFYGYSRQGLAYRGYFPWFYSGGYNFYRFDQRGFGDRNRGYMSRNYYPKNYNNRGGYYGDRNVWRGEDRRHDAYGNYGRYNNNNHYDNREYRREDRGRYDRPTQPSNPNPRNNYDNNGSGYNRPQERRDSNWGGRNEGNVGRSQPQPQVEQPQQPRYNGGGMFGGGEQRPSRGSSENAGGFTPRANGSRGGENGGSFNRMDNRSTESFSRHGRGSN